MSETVMKYRSTTRKVLQLQVLGIGIILFIDCICLILVVNYDRVYNKRSHDFVAEKAICVSCDELTHNGSTSGLDILRTLNMSQDGSQCCVEQLSALLELSMTEPQTIQDPLPVFDATNFSLSSASAHRRLLPLVYGRFEGPTFINETLKLAFYPAKIKEYAEHVRNVNITREGMTITIPGHYMVYSSLHYIPESEKPCKDFSEQKWLHNVMRTRPGRLEGPEVLLSGAYTCCDECFGIHETIYTAGMFHLKAGDQLHVEVSGFKILSYQIESTFLGVFMMG